MHDVIQQTVQISMTSHTVGQWCDVALIWQSYERFLSRHRSTDYTAQFVSFLAVQVVIMCRWSLSTLDKCGNTLSDIAPCWKRDPKKWQNPNVLASNLRQIRFFKQSTTIHLLYKRQLQFEIVVVTSVWAENSLSMFKIYCFLLLLWSNDVMDCKRKRQKKSAQASKKLNATFFVGQRRKGR